MENVMEMKYMHAEDVAEVASFGLEYIEIFQL